MLERHEIRELMIRTDKARKRILQPEFSEIGLTLGTGQPRILDCLLLEDGITQRELANRSNMDVTTLSRALDRMEEAGLLNRERDPGCRRSFLILLTPAGREKAEKVHGYFSRLDDRIWEGFTEEKMEGFYQKLLKIYKNLESSG